MVNSIKQTWAGHVARIGGTVNEYRILKDNSLGKYMRFDVLEMMNVKNDSLLGCDSVQPFRCLPCETKMRHSSEYLSALGINFKYRQEMLHEH